MVLYLGLGNLPGEQIIIFQVRYSKEKGRGVFATRDFCKGEFVVEYSGELIDIQQAYLREEKYEQDESMGCYMYYFKHNDHHYW